MFGAMGRLLDVPARLRWLRLRYARLHVGAPLLLTLTLGNISMSVCFETRGKDTSASLGSFAPRSDLLFVYGTLRGSDVEEAQVLAARAKRLGTATLQGRMYRCHEVAADGRALTYPAAVPGEADDDVVRGELFELPADPEARDELLSVLDRYEEFDAARAASSLFIRCILPVKSHRGRFVHAWVYVYNRPVDSLARISSGDFSPS